MAVLFQLLNFPQIVGNLQNLGFFQFLFPFLLSLAIIYGVLTKVAKDWLPRSARGLIAIIISFFVMLFAAENPAIVAFYTAIGGGGLIIASIILILIILMGMVGLRFEDMYKPEKGRGAKWAMALLIVILVLLFFFGVTGSAILPLPSWLSASDFWTVLFVIFILVLVFWWLGGEEKEEGGKQQQGP